MAKVKEIAEWMLAIAAIALLAYEVVHNNVVLIVCGAFAANYLWRKRLWIYGYLKGQRRPKMTNLDELLAKSVKRR